MLRAGVCALVLVVAGCDGDDPASASGGSPSGTGATSATSTSTSTTSSSGGSAGAPAGEGIASKYPGDVGIENDPDVILADGFETYAQPSELQQTWDAVFHMEQIRLATEP